MTDRIYDRLVTLVIKIGITEKEPFYCMMNGRINELFDSVRRYGNSEEFKELMAFCARFRQLAPYNAMLVNMQMPGARYVLSAKDWAAKFHREPAPNARPLIILVPFGPVQFIYDISQTVTGKGHCSKDDQMLETLSKPYEPVGGIDMGSYLNLVEALSYDGVRTDFNMRAAACYAGCIRTYTSNDSIYFRDKKRTLRIEYEMPFLMSINKDASLEEKFCSICHELGHLLAHHLPCRRFGWEHRVLSHYAEEFEAEAISWLVSQRHGIIDSRSDKYLGEYYAEHKTIPNISIGTILSAAAEIERRIKTPDLKKGLIYTYDKDFKEKIDRVLKEQKGR